MIRLVSYISIIFLCLSSTTNASAATVNEILSTAASKYAKCKSITCSFALIDNGHSQNGTITVAGSKFVITTPQISTWFDGKTQWSYSPSINEVNISEPTAEELQQINPFAIINSVQNDYTAKLLTSNKDKYQIQLSSKSSNKTIKNIELSLNSSTYFPSLIIISLKNNTKITINVKQVAEGNALPTSTFTFNTSKYPGVEVIDLR